MTARSVTAPPGRPDRGARIAGLVDAAREGSDDALGQIVTELSPLLWHVARAAGLSAGDAEDVVQTVWMRLLSHLDDIRTSAALTSWLVVTTRREAWRVRADGRRQLPADQEWFADAARPGTGHGGAGHHRRSAARAVGGDRPALRAVPGTAADHRLRAAPGLPGGGRRARHAGREHRPHPRPVPGQAPRPAGQ